MKSSSPDGYAGNARNATPAPSVSRDELDRLLADMAMVKDLAEDPWALEFARDMCRLGCRRHWRPSRRQLACMKLYSRRLAEHLGGEGGDL